MVDGAGHRGLTAPRLKWALQDALEHRGCPICRLVRDAEDGFWHFFVYEAFQEPDAARAVTASLGYCPRHLAQLRSRQDAFVLGTMALAALEGALATLRRAGARGLLHRRGQPLGASAPCPVCSYLGGLERQAVATLTSLVLEDGDVRERLRMAGGVCFEHLTLTADGPGDDALREDAARRLEDQRNELRAFLGAFDHRAGRPTPRQAESVGAAWTTLRGDPGRRAP